MRRALLLVALFAAACGTSREERDAGSFDGGTSAKPLAVTIYEVGFACAGITQDFSDDFLCADPDAGVLRVLSGDGLGVMNTETVIDGSWSDPQLSVGRGGQAFLSADLDGGSQVWSLDLGADAVSFIGQLPPANGFHARRDAPGFVYAPAEAFGDGGFNSVSAVVVGEDGGTEQRYELGEFIQDLASAPAGALFASTCDLLGQCTGVRKVGTDAGISLDSGRVPCELGLSPDGSTLWLATSGDHDATALVHAYDAASLRELGRWSISDFTPTFHSVLIAGNGTVAVLGFAATAAGNTVALGRASWLAQDGGFQSVTGDQVGNPADAVFDESGALYVADPLHQTIDLVR